ncbi:riboflavin transporter FmnP [Scopulibacillus darangshiensis]|uniref:Riboflavin transporter n=2 Tax=Scopulibacillus darangshiensis TaxID=442528 RepID=A0A4R2P559_9BACL|nr:riboflavin transporter FmnP [Scopulibacillus darangshiensis]
MKTTSLKQTVSVALLSAIAFLIMVFSFPMPLFPVFLTLDFSDVPAIVGTIMFGPVAGIVIEGLKNLLHYLLIGSATGVPVGELANFIAGSLLIVTGTWIYRKRKTTGSLIGGLLFGTVIMTIVMSIANYFIIFPSYAMFLGFGIDQAVAAANAANHSIHNLLTLIVFAVLPFNLLKGIILTVIIIPIYIRLRPRLGAMTLPKVR